MEEKKPLGFKAPVINHSTRTITMTEKFNRAASLFGTDEFKYLAEVKNYLPDYAITVKHSHNASAHITYKKMGQYINCLKNEKEINILFDKVKKYAEAQPFPYIVVENWFKRSFPDYGKTDIQFDKEGYPIINTSIVPFEKVKEEAEAQASA